MVVRHWRIHNYIQKDRYKPTMHQNEKNQLVEGENRVYNLNIACIHDVSKLEPSCIHDGADSDTQVRLGEVSLGKVREDNNSESDADLSSGIFELSTDERSIANIILQQWHYQPTEDDIEQAIEQLKRLNNDFNLFETALGISAEYGERACNWRYLSKIIDNWIAKGYQTEEDILMHELSRKSNAYLKHQNRMER